MPKRDPDKKNRRVWKIDTPRLSKKEAEEYIRELMRRYRRKEEYDTSGITPEDFWFRRTVSA